MNTQSAMDFMVIFDLFIGVYLLYYAIMGRGQLYEGDYPEEMMAEHRALLRKFCWIVSIPMLVLSVLELQGGSSSIWSVVTIVFGLSAVVVYFIIFMKKFRKYLKPERGGSGSTKKKR